MGNILKIKEISKSVSQDLCKFGGGLFIYIWYFGEASFYMEGINWDT